MLAADALFRRNLCWQEGLLPVVGPTANTDRTLVKEPAAREKESENPRPPAFHWTALQEG
jgi:hypothetical protein